MGLIALFGVLFWVMIFIAYVLLLSAVYKYATRLGQERITWVVISLFCSPVVGLIGLYMEGESDEHRKARVIEEEMWRRSYSNIEIPTPDITHESDIMNTLTNG